MISISSISWIGMWIGLEINLLSIIPLINRRKNLYASEASLKYFITQALASTILLFSIILILNNFSFIFNLKRNIILIFNSALLTKIGAAPFHFWFPEIIEGLSWWNCLILLSWQKITPIVIFIYNIYFPWFIVSVIIFRILIRGIIGFNQTRIRKILAYSSINHIAWILAAILLIETTWLTYFLIYTIISINIILIFNLLNIFYLKQLLTSINNDLSVKFFFVINFLSLGGLPPFLGFLPKWITIQNLIENELPILTFFMVILTLLTLFFYIRLTYRTLTINLSEPNFSIKSKINQFWIFWINLISLISLIFYPLFLI